KRNLLRPRPGMQPKSVRSGPGLGASDRQQVARRVVDVDAPAVDEDPDGVSVLYGKLRLLPFFSGTTRGGTCTSEKSSGKVPKAGMLTRPDRTLTVRLPLTSAPEGSRTPCTSRVSDGLPAGM